MFDMTSSRNHLEPALRVFNTHGIKLIVGGHKDYVQNVDRSRGEKVGIGGMGWRASPLIFHII